MGREPFRLGVLTALWRRPRIAGAVLRHYAGLDVPGVVMTRVAARSPEDPERTEDVEGWEYVEAPNDPLSDKLNAGATALKGRVDGVMVVGSDDLIDGVYVAQAVRSSRTGSGMVYPSSCLFVDTETGRAFWAFPPGLGAGRLLSLELLESLEWRPWPEGLNIRLDAGMNRRMAEVKPSRRRDIRVAKGTVADLKSGVNIWPFEHMAAHYDTGMMDAHPWLERHFPQAYDELVTTHTLSPYDG